MLINCLRLVRQLSIVHRLIRSQPAPIVTNTFCFCFCCCWQSSKTVPHYL